MISISQIKVFAEWRALRLIYLELNDLVLSELSIGGGGGGGDMSWERSEVG